MSDTLTKFTYLQKMFSSKSLLNDGPFLDKAGKHSDDEEAIDQVFIQKCSVAQSTLE